MLTTWCARVLKPFYKDLYTVSSWIETETKE